MKKKKIYIYLKLFLHIINNIKRNDKPQDRKTKTLLENSTNTKEYYIYQYINSAKTAFQ